MNDITINRIDTRTAVIHPGINIDTTTAARLRNTLIGLNTDGVNQYIIDLTDVETVDNTGLSVLYRAWRRAITNGGGLSLAAPATNIRKALDAIRFPAQIHDTVETSLHRTMATV